MTSSGKQVTIGVRPEDLEVGTTKGDGLPVTVDLVEELGADGYLYGHADVNGQRSSELNLSVGEAITSGKAGVEADAEAGEVGDLFEYQIAHPVTVPTTASRSGAPSGWSRGDC